MASTIRTWKLEISQLARRDLSEIHAYTKRVWGVEASNRYSDLIFIGLYRLKSAPLQIGSHEIREVAADTYSYPLRNISQNSLPVKIKRPRHIIYYDISTPPIIKILRILHDQMDIVSHLKELDSTP